MALPVVECSTYRLLRGRRSWCWRAVWCVLGVGLSCRLYRAWVALGRGRRRRAVPLRSALDLLAGRVLRLLARLPNPLAGRACHLPVRLPKLLAHQACHLLVRLANLL